MYSTSTVAPVLGCGPHQQNDETPKKCHPIRTLWEVERRTHKSPVGLNLCLRLLLAEIQIWGLKTSQKKMPNHWGVPPFGRSIQPCPPGSKKRRFPVRGKWRLECSWQVELKASINKNKLVWVGFLASSYFDILWYTKPPSFCDKKCKIAFSDLFDWYSTPIRWNKNAQHLVHNIPFESISKNQKVLPRSCAIPQDRPETAMK